MKRISAFVIVLYLACMAGCAHQSVRHLVRNPWTFDANQVLETKFWRFQYEIIPMRDRFGVKGTAYIRADKIPQKATWIDDMWFAAYLSDAKGNVAAKDLRVFLPRPLDVFNGVDFEFILRPEEVESGPLFVSFGYRMVLTEGRLSKDKSIPFFASEGALNK